MSEHRTPSQERVHEQCLARISIAEIRFASKFCFYNGIAKIVCDWLRPPRGLAKIYFAAHWNWAMH
eukprot:4930658-Pyramimonas_sp.AAC.1